MYKFSLQSNEEINKDLQKIANVMLEEEFDIVALQEVFNETAEKGESAPVPFPRSQTPLCHDHAFAGC